MRTRPTKVLGVVLLIGGTVLALWSAVGYREREHAAEIGPIEVEVVERERPPVPIWVGLAVAGAGAILVLFPRSRP